LEGVGRVDFVDWVRGGWVGLNKVMVWLWGILIVYALFIKAIDYT
jgi:hypothetical protein